MPRIIRTPEHVTDADLLFGQIDDPQIRAQRSYLMACAVGRGLLIVLGVSVLAALFWHLLPSLLRAVPDAVQAAQPGGM